MTDVIRLDLTPEEAERLRHLLGHEVTMNLRDPLVTSVLPKLMKAQENPLNGPTFDYGKAKA